MVNDVGQMIRMKIGGMTYTLKADENEAYMRQIGQKADELIRLIMDENPNLNRAAAPILALINALDEVEKTKNSCREFLEMRDEVVKALQDLDAERLTLRDENWEMKKDLLYYRNLCEVYEERLAEYNLPVTPPSKKTKGGRHGLKEREKPLDQLQCAFKLEGEH